MSETDGNEGAVLAALDALGIEYERIEIDPAFGDTADFCRKYGYPVPECGNTILIASRSEPRQFAACVVRADTRLDVNRRVRKLMGVRKASFASAEDTVAHTGMAIGGVTAFALPEGLPIYVDAAVFDLDRVILGSGVRSSKLAVAPDALRRVPGVEVVEGLAVGGDS